jgi:hypothetical protein
VKIVINVSDNEKIQQGGKYQFETKNLEERIESQFQVPSKLFVPTRCHSVQVPDVWNEIQ